MIRTVLAVLLATALLSVSLPALEAAGQQRSAAQMERAVDRVAVAAAELLEDDPGPTAVLSPRRVVVLRLPGRSLTTARVDRLRIVGGGDDPARISYAIDGHPPVVRRIDAPIVTPNGSVTVHETGRHRLVLRFTQRDREPAIVVSEEARSGDAETSTSHLGGDSGRKRPSVQIPGRGQVAP